MEPLIWEEYLSQIAEESFAQRPATHERRFRRPSKKASSKLPRKRKKKPPNVRP